MASLNLQSQAQSLSLSSKPSLSPQIQSSSLSFRFSPSFAALFKKPLFSITCASTQAPPANEGGFAPVITLTENALKQLNTMRFEKNEDLYARISVKRSGCSDLSYAMEFEGKQSSRPNDCVMEYDGFAIVCDPESLIILSGAQLDCIDAPAGGDFSFKNLNAKRTCNCARSFCCGNVNGASLHN